MWMSRTVPRKEYTKWFRGKYTGYEGVLRGTVPVIAVKC
jgi:hypothetical protein